MDIYSKPNQKIGKCLIICVLLNLVACSGANSDPSPQYSTASQLIVTSSCGPSPVSTPSSAFLSDSKVHMPSVTGQFVYNDWKPGAANFPKVGEAYVDPVFGGTIRRPTVS